MHNDKFLDNLNSIDEVYDAKVNIIEEVLYYHKIKDELRSDSDVEQEEDIHDIEDPSDTIN
jgi:hypothetical protein